MLAPDDFNLPARFGLILVSHALALTHTQRCQTLKKPIWPANMVDHDCYLAVIQGWHQPRIHAECIINKCSNKLFMLVEYVRVQFTTLETCLCIIKSKRGKKKKV